MCGGSVAVPMWLLPKVQFPRLLWPVSQEPGQAWRCCSSIWWLFFLRASLCLPGSSRRLQCLPGNVSGQGEPGSSSHILRIALCCWCASEVRVHVFRKGSFPPLLFICPHLANEYSLCLRRLNFVRPNLTVWRNKEKGHHWFHRDC